MTESEIPSHELENRLQLLSEVPGIHESRNQLITGREKIKDLVETPLIKACEILYDKNIQTMESSANQSHIVHGHGARLVINYDSLSEENRLIADQVAQVSSSVDGFTAADVEIPLDENSTVEEIEQKFVKIAEQFKSQALTWSPTYTLEQLTRIYDPSGASDGKWQPEDFGEQFYYDPVDRLFYRSEEHFRKAKGIT